VRCNRIVLVLVLVVVLDARMLSALLCLRAGIRRTASCVSLPRYG
jgi:hypothetical protein